jgi:hypothetical protein
MPPGRAAGFRGGFRGARKRRVPPPVRLAKTLFRRSSVAVTLNPPEKIVCRPTPWFLLRALAMLVMFGVFAVLFYIDGSTGYRKQNEAYYLHQAFRQAGEQFASMENDGNLTAERWLAHAKEQSVSFPEDRSILPDHLSLPMAWPEILHDFDRMRDWQPLWREYSGAARLPESPPEKAFDARKILEQWVVFWICLALALGAALILFRTMRRSITADNEAVTTQTGRRVPYSDLKVLDLRKWDTKGLAFADYDGASGKGRARIDGLTYGGFKKEHGEPAEALMRLIRSRFSGEVIEYAPVADAEEPAADSNPA